MPVISNCGEIDLIKMKQSVKHPYTIEKMHYKGYSIWKWNENSCSPMLILRKPKHLTDEQYESFVKSLEIQVRL